MKNDFNRCIESLAFITINSFVLGRKMIHAGFQMQSKLQFLYEKEGGKLIFWYRKKKGPFLWLQYCWHRNGLTISSFMYYCCNISASRCFGVIHHLRRFLGFRLCNPDPLAEDQAHFSTLYFFFLFSFSNNFGFFNFLSGCNWCILSGIYILMFNYG